MNDDNLINDDLRNWYCLMTFSKYEFSLTKRINDLGEQLLMTGYCPLDQYEFTPRTRKAVKKTIIVKRPMLQGYVFVNMRGTDQQWSAVRAMRGLYGVIVNQDRPVRIPVEAITEMRVLEADVLQEIPTLDKSIVVGSSVKVIRGEWKGKDYVVEAIDGPMATVSATLFGRPWPMKIPLIFLAKTGRMAVAKAEQIAYA